MRGTSLVRFHDYDNEPFTQAQVDRLASHLRDHLSDVDDRINAAEMLGLVGYVGHDTSANNNSLKFGQGQPVWRPPVPVISEQEMHAERQGICSSHVAAPNGARS